MNLTKAEIKAALQAHLDAKYGSTIYTVGDGVEYIALAEDLTTAALKTAHGALLTQSIFAGTLNLRNTGDSNPASVSIAHNPKMTQATDKAGYEEHLAAEVLIPVGKHEAIQETVFAYLDGSNYEGNFHGYKFEVETTYSILEDGTIEKDEAGNLIVRP